MVQDLGHLSPFIKPYAKNVGVILDTELCLDKQISSVVKNSFYQLRMLSRLKSFLSFNDLEKVFHAFITSRLDYCNSLYFGLSQSSLRRLQLVQNAAVRPLTGARRREHITPILDSLHWLPVVFRIQFKVLLFVFKALNGLAPAYINFLVQPYSAQRSLRSSNKGLLFVPPSRLKQGGDGAFSVAAPHLWNQLPQDIRSAPSIDVFKSRHFYEGVYDCLQPDLEERETGQYINWTH
ncbi:hypothetical protein UPYG_G00054060 [Umbra pygmaea]|uniref:Maturase K n=1 Tax=Umbra pygmaea TaxID=75934 RepID=A0ABD0XXC1_UMBPY